MLSYQRWNDWPRMGKSIENGCWNPTPNSKRERWRRRRSIDAHLLQIVSKFILDAFANLRKATIVLSVCPTVRMEQLGSHWTDFDETWYLSCFFRKSVKMWIRSQRIYWVSVSSITISVVKVIAWEGGEGVGQWISICTFQITARFWWNLVCEICIYFCWTLWTSLQSRTESCTFLTNVN